MHTFLLIIFISNTFLGNVAQFQDICVFLEAVLLHSYIRFGGREVKNDLGFLALALSNLFQFEINNLNSIHETQVQVPQ